MFILGLNLRLHLPNQCLIFSLEEIPIFYFIQFEPRQYAYQFEQYAYFFSKRASGMLKNDMLIKKYVAA